MVEDNVGLMLTLYHHEKHLCLLLDPFCSGISRDLFTGLSLKYGCKLLAVRYKQYSIMLWTPRWAFSIPHKKIAPCVVTGSDSLLRFALSIQLY